MRKSRSTQLWVVAVLREGRAWLKKCRASLSPRHVMLFVSLMTTFAVLGTSSAAVAGTPGLSLPATFSGTSCSVHLTLTLYRNGVGFMRGVAGGRELLNQSGRFTYDDSGSRVIFDPKSANPGPFYQVVDERTLQRLGSSGGTPDSQCDERLVRSAQVIAISGVLKPVTLSSDVWTAESLGGARMLPEASYPRFTLDPREHAIAGDTGCGSFSGSYAVDGVRMRFPIST